MMTRRGTEVLVVGLVVVVASVGAAVTTTTATIEVEVEDGVWACADPLTPKTRANAVIGARKRFAFKVVSSEATSTASTITSVIGELAQ